MMHALLTNAPSNERPSDDKRLFQWTPRRPSNGRPPDGHISNGRPDALLMMTNAQRNCLEITNDLLMTKITKYSNNDNDNHDDKLDALLDALPMTNIHSDGSRSNGCLFQLTPFAIPCSNGRLFQWMLFAIPMGTCSNGRLF